MRKKTQIIKFKNLKRKSGLYYLEDISEPFSGIAETWDVDGHLEQRLRLKNGKKDGMKERFHDNEELWYRVFFIEGIRQWSEDFYESGELECRVEYKNGNFHYQEYFYENGQLQSKTHFIMIDYRTFVDGLQEGFHMNGQLSFSKNYKNGQKEGLFEYFDQSGRCTTRIKYKNGRRVRK